MNDQIMIGIIVALFSNVLMNAFIYGKLAQRLARVETHIVHIMKYNGMHVRPEDDCEAAG